MKRCLLFLLVVLGSVTLCAQDCGESIVYLNGGTYYGAHNDYGAYMGLEYDSRIKGNWYWGARLSGTHFLGNPITYEWSGYGENPYRNTVDQNIYKADVMLYYRFPITRHNIMLRAGTGFGMAYHDIIDVSFNGTDKVIPYLNASLNWIIRCGRHLEFVLSPTIAIAPSEFDYSFVQLGGRTDINPWFMNYFYLGIGYRF
ncbi:MAG: hypothetical protein MJZ06_02545 [Bacteroidaceae bacterium]|nr:hypothetical protein [Bacteroidaceae bacterium]